MQFIVDILYSQAFLVIIALGFALIYSTQRFLNFLQAVFITLSAYAVYSLSLTCNLPFSFSVLLAIAASVLLSVAINVFVYLFFSNKKYESWQMMIASLGVYVVLQNVVSMIWGDSTLSFRTWEVKVGHELFGAYITDVQVITLVVCLILLVLVWLFIEKTNVGKQIKAVSINDELSGILGLNRNRAKMWSIAIGTALAAFAGILIAADTDMTPTMGFNWLLYAVVAMIIGGMGKMRYLLLGTLLLAVAQHLAAYYLDSKWMNATAYIILIVFLYFRPTGFSGKQLKKSSI